MRKDNDFLLQKYLKFNLLRNKDSVLRWAVAFILLAMSFLCLFWAGWSLDAGVVYEQF